jgi:Ca-activated chloride channel family protein
MPGGGRQAAFLLAAGLVMLAGCERRSASSAPAAAPVAAAASAPPPSASAALAPRWPGIATGEAQAPETDARRLMARNYYVVFDGSGSMREQACGSGAASKIDAAKRALGSFAQSVPADANLGLLVFDHHGVHELLPLAPSQPGRFAQLVNDIQASGGTPLRSSIRMAYGALTAQGRRQLGYGEYHLVVVTDGEANAGEDPRDVVGELLRRSPVVLHTIGFCLGADHSLNQPGRTLYRAADNPEALARGLGDVLAEAPAFDLAGFGR